MTVVFLDGCASVDTTKLRNFIIAYARLDLSCFNPKRHQTYSLLLILVDHAKIAYLHDSHCKYITEGVNDATVIDLTREIV